VKLYIGATLRVSPAVYLEPLLSCQPAGDRHPELSIKLPPPSIEYSKSYRVYLSVLGFSTSKTNLTASAMTYSFASFVRTTVPDVPATKLYVPR
jgi:hypothetical protein